jgi:DNA topoisomerase-1
MPPKFFYKKKSKGLPSSSSTKKADNINFNATYLIIVESPSKCSKIEGFLGSDYCCIASKGHIRSIEGLKSIDTKKTFEPTFSIIEEKTNHVEYMRSIISRFSKNNIILASDDDREGEAIAWHICKIFDLPLETTKRILFHEITKTAIVEAIKNPTTINMKLVQAQHARQVLDMIVGYKISPFLWKYLYHNKSNSLSAGRCQTPALRLVYDNDKNKNAGLETRYKTTGSFFSKQILFELNHEFETKEKVIEFLEKSKGFSHILKIGSQRETKKSPPKPFNTSRLLQTASNMLHISPNETMKLCQTLYQNGMITYMRTDSVKYAGNFLNQVNQYIINEFQSPEYLGNMEVLENKDKNNPHEAIRVTHIETKNISQEGEDIGRLSSMYRLIWRNSIESCMSEARYNSTDIKLSAPLEKEYKYTIEVPIFLGWKKVSEKNNEKGETERQNESGSLLMYFNTISQSKNLITYNYIDSIVVVRNTHTHYTEATLINTLEELGIGRPSTFASIVDTIQERGYVKRTNLEGETKKCEEFRLQGNELKKIEKERTFGNEKNKLVLQPVGLLTIEFLITHFQKMFEYEYTKCMEDTLDDITTGKEKDWSNICKLCYNEIKELAKPMAKLEKQIYHLDDTHDFIFEKFGPVIRSKKEDGSFEYKNVKKELKIDLEKLKNGGYTADELYEIKDNYLGKYEDLDMYIKTGKFGPYVEWGENRESIKKITKPLNEITLKDVVEYLGSDITVKNKSVLRVFTPELSIRKGKFGPYAYYKRENMSKPEFYNIKKFPEGFSVCQPETFIQWIKTTYNVPITKNPML